MYNFKNINTNIISKKQNNQNTKVNWLNTSDGVNKVAIIKKKNIK